MTVRAVRQVGGGIGQRISVTADTVISRSGCHQVAVINHMDRVPGGSVTRGAIATGTEGLRIGAVGGNQAAVGLMTAGAGVVSIRCGAGQRAVGMTGGAIGQCDLNQSGVSRGIGGVCCFPTRIMTGGTVAAG